MESGMDQPVLSDECGFVYEPIMDEGKYTETLV